jgi:molybdate transport system regulatory protein
MGGIRLTLRVDFGPARVIGPGKVLLLEAIRDTGSISQAGRSLGMSYRRAWLLVQDMNRWFRDPVVTAQPGGLQGGGAVLTSFGEKLIGRFRFIEAEATAAAKPQLHELEASLRTRSRSSTKARKAPIREDLARQ